MFGRMEESDGVYEKGLRDVFLYGKVLLGTWRQQHDGCFLKRLGSSFPVWQECNKEKEEHGGLNNGLKKSKHFNSGPHTNNG